MSRFGEQVEEAQAAFDSRAKKKLIKVWRLIVWGVGPEHAGIIARLKMIPTEKNPTAFWREYPANKRSQVEAAIERLKSAGLHGIARKGERTERYRAPKKFRVATSREGFGGKLNAKPISGSWRRRTKRS